LRADLKLTAELEASPSETPDRIISFVVVVAVIFVFIEDGEMIVCPRLALS
jgi:hypothetical protein